MEKNKTLEIAKQLISIPSYVGSDCNEEKIGNFIYDFIRNNTGLNIEKQYVEGNRFNLLITDDYPPKVIFCGHLDTVQPRSGWNSNPITPVIKGDKLYGLGSSDMKGNLASLLSALIDSSQTRGLMIFLYVDEEYDFKGMKKFLSFNKDNFNPSLIVSLDGADLKVGNGCRGLIEIRIQVKGITGHASRPWNGINAITKGIEVIATLETILKNQFSVNDFGATTLNLASCRGGLNLGTDEEKGIIIGGEGNNIADFAEFIIDIRPASFSLNASQIKNLLKKLLGAQGLKLIDFTIRHDLKPWFTEKQEIPATLNNIFLDQSLEYLDIGSIGYIDTQMLWETFNKVPCVTLGAGNLELAHKPNEWISIDKMNSLEKIIQKLLKII